MQMGINHFGHFYLTYNLWNLIKASPNPRIINLSSTAHRMNGFDYKIDFNNIFFENGTYGMWKTYGASKLAIIMFTR